MVIDRIPSVQDYIASLVPRCQIHNTQLMITSCIHKSYASDFKHPLPHNERLEFLGDAILGSIVARQLFIDYPDQAESKLTLYKIALVREEHLALIARQIGIAAYLFLGNGEEKMWWRNKDVILADAVEALIGFLSIDQWYNVAQQFVLDHLYPHIIHLIMWETKSYKTMYQELVQSRTKITPHYVDTVVEMDPKDNPTLFASMVMVWEEERWYGQWINKKRAQEEAAKDAYEKEQL